MFKETNNSQSAMLQSMEMYLQREIQRKYLKGTNNLITIIITIICQLKHQNNSPLTKTSHQYVILLLLHYLKHRQM